jgi:HEAT repeat protein
VLRAATDQSADVRRFAVHALAGLGTDVARQRLSELAREDPTDFVRAAARHASNAT